MRIEDIIPRISVSVPLAPDPVIELTLIDTTRLFLRETGAWRVDVSGTIRDNGKLFLPPPSDGEIIDLVYLDDAAGNRLTKQLRSQNRHAARRSASFYWLSALNEISSEGLAGREVTGRAKAIPTIDAAEFDDLVWSRIQDYVLSGTIAALLNLHGTPWADPASAQHYGMAFGVGINAIKAKADDEFSNDVSRNVGYGGY